MSIPLFLKNIKENSLFLLVFILLMNIYLAVIIFMYDPNGIGAFNDIMALLPSTLVRIMGFSGIESSMTGFLGGLFFGFAIYLFPMIYAITMGNRLVTKYVYEGSMANFLTTSNSRIKIILTQALYLILSIALLFLTIQIVGLKTSEYFYPGVLNTDVFWQMNLGACLLTMTIAMIGFLFACLFNDSRLALTVTSSVTILFFIVTVLGRSFERFLVLEKFSLYSLYDGPAIAAGQADVGVMMGIFMMIILLSLLGSLGVFVYKRLPI